MDRICLTAGEAAELFGLEVQTIRQMRMAPTSSGGRKPPDNWRTEFARVARQKGGDMENIAAQLEAESA
jgi:hypothetical protein